MPVLIVLAKLFWQKNFVFTIQALELNFSQELYKGLFNFDCSLATVPHLFI